MKPFPVANLRATAVNRAMAVLAGLLGAVSLEAAPTLAQFKDPKDNGFDASSWLLSRHGFLPVPIFITEPALGYGGGVAVMLLHYPPGKAPPPTGAVPPGQPSASASASPPPSPTTAATGAPPPQKYTPPSMTGIAAFGTDNGTWGGGLFHMGVWREDRWRYMGGLGGGEIHLKFYGEAGGSDLASGLDYETKAWFLFQQIVRRIRKTDFFGGIRYMGSSTQTRFELGSAVPGLQPVEYSALNSGIGLILNYDTRDNSFTPNRGWKIQLAGTCFDEALGGDFDYIRTDWFSAGWWPIGTRLVLGWKAGAHFTDGHAPFYDLPSISLRGVPLARFQGKQEVDTELELRWAVTERWSLVGFGGAGRVAKYPSDLDSAETISAGGVGFRYLLSRAIGIHSGVDFAWSKDEFAWYITIGNAWKR